MCKKSHFSTIECDFICSVGSVQSSKFQAHIPQLKTTWSYSRWWWRSPWRHSHLRFHSCPHGLVLRPRRFCWICADFAPIFEPKSWSQTNKLDLVFLKLKNGNPFVYWEFPIFLGWVPGRTRTVDIQNHKQICECLKIPLFIGVSAVFDFWFAAILRLFTQGPILFQ